MKQEIFNLKRDLNNLRRQVVQALTTKDRKYITFLTSELNRIETDVDKEESIEKELAKKDKAHFFDNLSFYLLRKNIKQLKYLLHKRN